MVFSEQVRAVLQSRERRPDPAKLSVEMREVHNLRLHAEHAFRHARLVGYDTRHAVVTTPTGHHGFEVVRLGWGRMIVHGDLAPVTFRAGDSEVAVLITRLAASTLEYASGKAEGDWRVYSAEAFAAYLTELYDDTEDMARRAALFELLTLVRRDEAGVFVLSSGGGAWVQPGRAPRWMRVLGVEDLIPRAHRVNKRHATRCGSFAPIEPGDPWASLVTPGLPREATLQ